MGVGKHTQPGPKGLFSRAARIAVLSGGLAFSSSAAHAQTAAQPSSSSAAMTSVADSFAPYAKTNSPDLRIPGNAVDLSTFEPKRELAPKPPALGGRTVRSLGTGVASYYGKRFHGRLTANGERFNMRAMTAAHKTLPFGTKVRVTNPRNGRAVVVRINDRGPFIRGRTIDLSRSAAEKIGMIATGHARVKLEIVR